MPIHLNKSTEEIEKFNALANDWWDPHGPLKTLHAINPLRLDLIQEDLNIKKSRVLDIGCGGGILSESLAKAGAIVKGIDLSEEALSAARTHAAEHKLTIDYQSIASATLATQQPHYFDIITCMELLEHIPDPQALINDCATLVKPGGWVFFSTLNRHPKAYLLAILAAEYVMKLVPQGTHDYDKFIRPAELHAWATDCGLTLHKLTGLRYNPWHNLATRTSDVRVNYLAAYQKN